MAFLSLRERGMEREEEDRLVVKKQMQADDKFHWWTQLQFSCSFLLCSPGKDKVPQQLPAARADSTPRAGSCLGSWGCPQPHAASLPPSVIQSPMFSIAPTGFLLLSLLCSFPKSDLKSPTCLHCGPLAGVLSTTHARMRCCAGFSTEPGTSLHLLPGTLTPCLLEPHAGIPAESLHRFWPLELLAGSSSATQDSIPARQGQLRPTHLVSEPGPGPGDEERARVGLPVVKEGMRKTRRGRWRPVGTGEPRATPAPREARLGALLALHLPPSLLTRLYKAQVATQGSAEDSPEGSRASTPTPCLRFSSGSPFIARFSFLLSWRSQNPSF